MEAHTWFLTVFCLFVCFIAKGVSGWDSIGRSDECAHNVPGKEPRLGDKGEKVCIYELFLMYT